MFRAIILPHPEGNNRDNKGSRAVSGIRPEVAKSRVAENEQILKADARKNLPAKWYIFRQNISKLKLQLITCSPFKEAKQGLSLKWLNYS